METCYRVASKFLAMVHLGYIPYYSKQGLCFNLEQHLLVEGFDYAHVEAVLVATMEFFQSSGFNTKFPVEGSSNGYALSGHKYRGIVGVKRRVLAKALAIAMVKFAKEAAYGEIIHPGF